MENPLKFWALLLQILVEHVYSTNAEHQPRRIFNGGRAMQATPYGPRKPSFKPFAHKGGPPDVEGVWTGDRYIGLLPPGDGFASTVYLEDGTFQQQMGRYLSWECTNESGVYIATAIRADTYSNGTIEYRQRCEVGKVDLAEGVYYWKSSADECPSIDSSDFNNPLTRVKDSISFPGASTLYCNGNAGAGFTNVGEAGLDAIRTDGVFTGPPLPPPLDPNASFPPKFAQPSGPKDISGIWYSDESRTGELIDSDGSFSSVALLPDGTFMTVLGLFNSNNCTGPGMYSGSITYTQTYQDLKRVSSDGCTSGAVDLEAQTYTWSSANGPRNCPNENSIKFTFYRAGTSEALPTPASYACS
ncbi:hypothetical protein Ndes2526B_g09680 [Nannochloris sp. 'desiccata']|nr:hypothetical protein NADE_007369 [Chlorella desiccata (nom. nud.)]KAH7615839.1 hypothetical protein NADE_007628 [Chlorella desiccata (nom. nud.)]